MFSTLSKTNFNFSVRFILSSAKFNAFNLGESKILLFGKELKPFLPAHCSNVFNLKRSILCCAVKSFKS